MSDTAAPPRSALLPGEPALMTLARQDVDGWWPVYRWDAGDAQGRIVARRMTLRMARRLMLREPFDEDSV